MDKKLFMNSFLTAYIEKHINNNLNCHQEFYAALKAIDKTKKSEVIWDYYERIRMLINYNSFDVMNLNFEKGDPARLFNLIEKNATLFDSIKESIAEKELLCLQYIYQCVVRQNDYEGAATCVGWLLNHKKWNVHLVILINLFVYMAKNGNRDVYKYITLTRELLYFKSNQKILKARFRLVYVCLWVLINGVHTEKLKKVKNGEMAYLFAVCSYDENMAAELERVREAVQKKTIEHKNIYSPYEPSTGDYNINISKNVL